jgi:hypothetical protein
MNGNLICDLCEDEREVHVERNRHGTTTTMPTRFCPPDNPMGAAGPAHASSAHESCPRCSPRTGDTP